MIFWGVHNLRRLMPAVLTALLLLHAPVALAQGYLYRNYSERDGLINNAVNGMTQGADGRLWFATRGGIISYDGQAWQLQGLEQGVREKEFALIIRGRKDRIWAVSRRVPYRVQYSDGGNWGTLPLPPLPYLNTQACVLAAGDLDDGSEALLVGLQSGHFSSWHHGRWHLPADGLPSPPIRAFTWYQGKVLAASAQQLFMVDPVSLQTEPVDWPGLPAGPVVSLAVEPVSGTLYLVGGSWIAVKDEAGVRVLATDLEILTDQVLDRTDALVDRSGGVYFGGLERVYYWDPVLGLENLDTTTGRQAAGATRFFTDAEGNTWICSLRGVSKLTSRRFASFNRNQGLLQDEVTAVLEDRRGRIILGHEGGLTILDPEPRTLAFDLEPGDKCRVMGLAEDDRGNLWVATDGQGLGRIDPAGSIRWFGLGQGLHHRVFSVHVDRQGRLWAGTVVGFNRMQGDAFTEVPLPLDDDNYPPFVRRIFEASDGSLYLATGRNGVYRLDGGRITQWRGDDLVTGNSTFGFYESPEGEIWVGAGSGLFVLQGDRLEPTSSPRPVISRPVYSLAKDHRGKVWFGTDDGVFIWDGQVLKHYSVGEGLIGPEINRAGFLADSMGRFWVGTDRGVSFYRAEADLPPLTGPRLEILELEVDGRSYPVTAPIKLRGSPQSLYVRFRVSSFIDEKGLGCRTWLENFEPGWSEYSSRPLAQVRYNNLPAGTYHFHVQARNPTGLESQVVSAPPITVKQTLWKSWWFLLLGVILVTVLGYFLISFWEGKRYARRLEEEVAQRTTDLESSERAVRAESQRLAATLNSILDGVLALDVDDRVLLCNPAAESILDRPADQLVGRPLNEVLPLESRVGTDSDEDQWEWNCRDRVGCPNRGTICLEVSSSPLTDSGGRRTGSVVAFSDITDRLRMERELVRAQKLESLGLLAGGIAHDFNNLLTIMLGNIDLVESAAGLEDIDRESLMLAKQASSRARTLTEQLLTFARGGAPRQQTTPLQELIEQSVALSFSGLNVTCSVEVPEDLWRVHVDPGQINQVLNNLLINAAQAMPDGGQVVLRARNLSQTPDFLAAGQWVRIEVADRGPGIPEANLSRIFDPYFTTKREGTGLGLATSFSIISRHGGRITVDSREGRGTTFSVFLPRSLGEPAAMEDAPAIAPQSGGRVLVLEDEEGIHRILKRYLASLEMQAVFTTDGQKTVAEYTRAFEAGNPYAVVLTDLTIPDGMGGRETLERLLAVDPQVRAVVVSGYSHEDVMANYRQYGFRAALGKPFRFEDLARVLAEVLDEPR
jgi:PAS domain S-box-containing protein